MKIYLLYLALLILSFSASAQYEVASMCVANVNLPKYNNLLCR